MNTETQMTGKKQMINDEMNYFFGFSRGSYGEVLGDLSRTCVNSCLTSSIPLAEFWQPANLEAIRKLFAPFLPDFNPETALKFFEFPTEALFDGERVGRPSMTDIMILDSDFQMAIEGKQTEYVRFTDKTIREWLDEMPGGTDIMLRRRVLKAWLRYIHHAGCIGLADYADFLKCSMDVSYQFLHRTASACNKAGAGTGSTPILVRHAERPPLPANDLTFGRDQPMTERGAQDATRFGRELRLFACMEQMTIAAGGNRRCMETAFHILEGVGLDMEDDRCAVLADPYLGSRAFYFGDVAARMELANAGNYLESLNAYFTCGRQKGFNDLHPSTSHLAGHLLNHYDAPLFIGVTHDLNCASP